jgi:hypothetical protein
MDIMNNKKVVGEVRELLSTLMELLNKMEANDAPSDYAPSSPSNPVTKSIDNGPKDDKDSLVSALRETCKRNDYDVLPLIDKQLKDRGFHKENMELIAPSKKYAKVLIMIAYDSYFLALSHPDVSMAKYMCMLVQTMTPKIPTSPVHLHFLTGRQIMHAISNQDLPSLRYFHNLSSWEGLTFDNDDVKEWVEVALQNPNLQIIRYMRDDMGINFYKHLKDISVMMGSDKYWVDRRIEPNYYRTVCSSVNCLWDLLCVLHELMYPKFDDVMVKLVNAGKTTLVLKAWRRGFISKTKVVDLMKSYPLAFVDHLKV